MLRNWDVQDAVEDTAPMSDWGIRKAGPLVHELRLLCTCVFFYFHFYIIRRKLILNHLAINWRCHAFFLVSLGIFSKNGDISYIIILQWSKPENLTEMAIQYYILIHNQYSNSVTHANNVLDFFISQSKIKFGITCYSYLPYSFSFFFSVSILTLIFLRSIKQLFYNSICVCLMFHMIKFRSWNLAVILSPSQKARDVHLL